MGRNAGPGPAVTFDHLYLSLEVMEVTTRSRMTARRGKVLLAILFFVKCRLLAQSQYLTQVKVLLSLICARPGRRS